jgi:hypothetical protein
MAYERQQTDQTYVASANGYVVVWLQASTQTNDMRQGQAMCSVDGQVVAAASVSLNNAPEVSSPVQSMTIPVAAKSSYVVQRVSGQALIEVRWFTY